MPAAARHFTARPIEAQRPRGFFNGLLDPPQPPGIPRLLLTGPIRGHGTGDL